MIDEKRKCICIASSVVCLSISVCLSFSIEYRKGDLAVPWVTSILFLFLCLLIQFDSKNKVQCRAILF